MYGGYAMIDWDNSLENVSRGFALRNGGWMVCVYPELPLGMNEVEMTRCIVSYEKRFVFVRVMR